LQKRPLHDQHKQEKVGMGGREEKGGYGGRVRVEKGVVMGMMVGKGELEVWVFSAWGEERQPYY